MLDEIETARRTRERAAEVRDRFLEMRARVAEARSAAERAQRAVEETLGLEPVRTCHEPTPDPAACRR